MYVQRFEEELDDAGVGETQTDETEGWIIHHTAETSRHIAGSDVMPEISTNNLYADVSTQTLAHESMQTSSNCLVINEKNRDVF